MITYELITPKSALADLLWAYLYRRPSSGHSALCRPKHDSGHGSGNCGVAALDDGRVVGMVIGTRRFGAYYGRCTYVKPTYRGKGIATALWTKLLGQWPSRKVYLVAFSDLGKTMVESLKQQYPDTKWYITEEGDRPLRRLSRGE